jgi:hypothetical protein
MSGAVHVKPHAPAVHVGVAPVGAEQVVPHLPQLVGLADVSTQEPLHAVRFAAQPRTQAPAEQTLELPQALSQVLQWAASDVRSTQAPPQLV